MMKMSRADRKNFVDSWYTPDHTPTYSLAKHPQTISSPFVLMAATIIPTMLDLWTLIKNQCNHSDCFSLFFSSFFSCLRMN